MLDTTKLLDGASRDVAGAFHPPIIASLLKLDLRLLQHPRFDFVVPHA